MLELEKYFWSSVKLSFAKFLFGNAPRHETTCLQDNTHSPTINWSEFPPHNNVKAHFPVICRVVYHASTTEDYADFQLEDFKSAVANEAERQLRAGHPTKSTSLSRLLAARRVRLANLLFDWL